MSNLYLETENCFVECSTNEEEGMAAWDAEALGHDQMAGCAGGESRSRTAMRTGPGKGYRMGQKVGNALVTRAELDSCLQQKGGAGILIMVPTHK